MAKKKSAAKTATNVKPKGKRSAAKSGGKHARIKSAPENAVLIQELRTGLHTIKFKDITKVHPGLRGYFCYNLSKVAHQNKSVLDKALMSLNLQSFHIGVLRIIELSEKVNQNTIADELGIDKASLVKIIDHLENMKLVQRRQSSEDRRVNFLEITPKGAKVQQKAKLIADQEEKKFFHALSESELTSLKDFLHRLLK